MGGGWQEIVDNYRTMAVGNDKQHECVVDDEGRDKEGKGSKGNGYSNEGGE